MRNHGILVLALVLPPAAAAGQAREGPPVVNIDATASVDREPDRARLTLAVETEGRTAQAASQGNAEAMGRVVAALRRARIEGPAVRTLSVQLNPVYAPTGPNRDEAPRIAGYRALNLVQITIDSVARVGGIIDAAIGAGANRVANLSFELKNPDEARLAALTEAMAQAKREAEAVARAAGRTLGPPIEITVNSSYPGPRPMYAERSLAMSQAADTPVEGGAITITATVHVVYRLEPQ